MYEEEEKIMEDIIGLTNANEDAISESSAEENALVRYCSRQYKHRLPWRGSWLLFASGWCGACC